MKGEYLCQYDGLNRDIRKSIKHRDFKMSDSAAPTSATRLACLKTSSGELILGITEILSSLSVTYAEYERTSLGLHRFQIQGNQNGDDKVF